MHNKTTKSKSITVNLTENDYNKIKEYAIEREWTLSKAVQNLLSEKLEKLEETQR